jgi:hypothetical protein
LLFKGGRFSAKDFEPLQRHGGAFQNNRSEMEILEDGDEPQIQNGIKFSINWEAGQVF